MTTRLTRWLTTLDNFEAKMAQLPAVRRYGRLTRATGLVLEATGLQLPLGATCVIERQNGSETHEVESEVVGFNGQRLFLCWKPPDYNCRSAQPVSLNARTAAKRTK